jgi:hypothetical protein
MPRYSPDRRNYVKCVDCVAEGKSHPFYGSFPDTDGKYRCEPHRVRHMYTSGAKEGRGGFIL